MIEPNNPEINVDDLMQKVRDEVARHNHPSHSVEENSNGVNAMSVLNTSNIEPLINDAEFNSQASTKWPDKLNRFPFNFSKRLQRFILKLYRVLFKKQRVVNFDLSQALRESLALNRELVEQVITLQAQFRTTDERVSEIGDHVTATDERISEIINRLKATDERQLRDNSYFKNDLAQQKRLINIFLEEARQRLPEPFSQEQLQTFVNEEQHLLDPFYAAFEERFRGSREEVLNKLKVYLPLLEEAKVGTPEYLVLDVGCGRGEWLELLRKSGYTARGVDSNWIQVDFCEARGLEIVEGDVIF